MALERSPIVYHRDNGDRGQHCLEVVNAGGAERLEAIRVAPGSVGVMEDEVAGGALTVLEAPVQLEDVADNGDFPHLSEATETTGGTVSKVRLVTYFAWGNRRPGQTMRVWVPKADK